MASVALRDNLRTWRAWMLESLLSVLLICATSGAQSGMATTHDHKRILPRENNVNQLYVSTSGSDSNPCTSRAPCKSISRASQAALAGTVVHVAPGTYTGDFVTSTSGTAAARITFLSDTRWGAKLVGSSGKVLWQLNASYVDVIGFDMSGPNAAGVVIGWSGLGAVGYDRLLYNYVHDLTVSGGCNSTGGAALDTGQATSLGNNEIIGNRVANIGASMIGSCNTVQGIYIATANDLVANNVISGVACGAISQWHGATASTIVNNTVFHSKVGIILGDGDAGTLPGGSVNNLVANNIAVNNQYGIAEIGSMGPGNRYLNNLVFNNSGQNLRIWSATPAGTLVADPQFVNYKPDGSGDYHLSAHSPAINRGTPTRAPDRDHDGGARPVGSDWDLGAYEAGAPPARWPWVGNIADSKEPAEKASRLHHSEP